MPFGNVTKQRQIYSNDRLGEITSAIRSSEILTSFPDVCIYVTGSYGRGEAHKESDLDLFFLHKGSQQENGLSRTQEIIFYSEIINLCHALKFPQFSGGGKYLKTQYVDDGMGHLGGPIDDYENYFTARVLLLLESKPILNVETFTYVLQKTLRAYYRDYDPAKNDFRPVFLLNDLLRYWKTLCLNYEHRRNEPPTDTHAVVEIRMDNLKLKFSRLLTCFSMILGVSQIGIGITAREVASISRKTPLQRLHEISEISMIIDDEFRAVLELYDWFLDVAGQPFSDLEKWIMDEKNFKLCRTNARSFGDYFYDITGKIILDDQLRRYLVI